ncbi:efflux RND transporter periplasmic adaptor subunit [Methylobrevis pamukkalensis]|uniref:Multidrug resistance protein MdtA n=1 Tax=Methylobrevis pamukkalensis TaxID=1439726 RepID=A0A1E3H7S7_9HYPH|nr:efflux RND transporter periplasmic adaptor subunit [Methylobrevis pamukkalensis]ODN72373.1 Multidrug resistance protein MdtA precursor [Methylobrevis pamukkalensis]
MVKRLIIAIILIAIVCGGIVGFNFFRSMMIDDFFANMQAPTVTVSSVDVVAETWTPGIDAIGTVSADKGVDVSAETGGVVKQIEFKANDRVEAGQLLVQIDSAIEEANLIAAQAAVTRDQQALDRAAELTRRGISSAADLENAQAALDASRSQLQSLQATLDQKSIEAPFGGTIGIPKIDIGEFVSAGTMIATLQDLETMKVDFTVPEQRLGEIVIGQTVRFGLIADEMSYEGEITGIDPKIDPASRLVSVQARLDNSDGKLRPGQFIFARVMMPVENEVIALPQTAVTTSLYGSYVYVIKEQPAKEEGGDAGLSVEQVFVQTGRRSGPEIEIVTGLKAGEKVVTAGQNRLSNGTLVVIDNTIDPTKTAGVGSDS